MKWQSSSGATSYRALAKGSGGYPASCSSNSTTCVFTGLLCGLTYSFSVSASDSMCTSMYSSSVQLNTVPCKPQNLSASVDCSTSTGLVSWEAEQGALFYMVQAVGANGYQTQCMSTNTSCLLPSLQCGQLYNVTSVSQDGRCNSSSAQVNLQSVPCVPTGVKASLLCSSNSVAVTWQSSSGALRYRADAVNINRSQTVSCNSSLPSCTVGQLLCGTSYNVTVVALDDECSSVKSLAAQVLSAPCLPQNVQVQMNCSAGVMTVTWAPNPDAEYFHVDAVSGNVSLSCNTSSTSCSIPGLYCGLSLSVTVRAIRGGCHSAPSAAVQALTAPCIPQGASGNLDCVTNSVWVSWQEAAGAESYKVLAVSAEGANSTCSTPGLFCNIPSLLCGMQYTFQVTAMNSWCASENYNNSFSIETGPCTLNNISVVTECRSSSIRVSWLTQSKSSIFVVTAEGQDLSFLQCNSTGTYCVLNGARCSMQYTIMVSTSSDKCSSLRSPPYSINTAPCAPQALSVNPLCDTEDVVVSWAPSNLSQSYYLTAIGQDGVSKNCTSTTENCTLSHLKCSQAYTVSVIASDGNCTSPASQALTFRTTPCAPLSLNVSLPCGDSLATLSWSSSNGSAWYYASAVNPRGDKLQCHTTNMSCTIAGLQCGMVYNFSVQASGGACNSSRSPVVQKGTVPCPPASVSVVIWRMENTSLVRVSWSTVSCLDVQYLAQLDGQFLLDPNALVQMASYWTDRTYFEFLVPCNINYTVVVSAGSGGGNGPPSSAVTGFTGLCPSYSTNIPTAVVRRRRELQEAEQENEDVLFVPEVKALDVDGVNLHVEWAPVTNASYYTLIVREDTESHPDKVALIVEGEASDVADLKPATRYCVTLSAKNSVAKSDYSPPVCITTGVPI
ncbi:fibronectin type III domain-containing protein 7 [Clarias gariepinus]